MSAQPGGPTFNAHDWADESGKRWLAHLPQFEGMLAPIGAKAMETAGFQPGERVVDVGCGGGTTTLDIARTLGPRGFALGVDVSPALVEAAQAKTRTQPGSAPARFALGDAATTSLTMLGDSPFDVLFSRFGVMFFADPIAAFANMRSWLKPPTDKKPGRLAFACWAPPKENPWLLEVQEILSRYVEAPKPDPLAPGPFAFADQNRVRDILTKAGFKAIAFDAWRGLQALGGPGMTPAQAAEFSTTAMHVGQMLAGLPDDEKAKAKGEVQALFAQYHTKDGVMMPSCAWIVTGTA